MAMDMDTETLFAGIEPGGISDKYTVRILICYLLSQLDHPLTSDQINLIFQSEHLVNYFAFIQAIQELSESGHIVPVPNESQPNNPAYLLNALGAETAMKLKNALPKSVRDSAVAAAERLLRKLKNERENEVVITELAHGYSVVFIVHDTEFDLMRLELLAPDYDQAVKMRTRFMRDPTKVYSGILEMLAQD